MLIDAELYSVFLSRCEWEFHLQAQARAALVRLSQDALTALCCEHLFSPYCQFPSRLWALLFTFTPPRHIRALRWMDSNSCYSSATLAQFRQKKMDGLYAASSESVYQQSTNPRFLSRKCVWFWWVLFCIITSSYCGQVTCYHQGHPSFLELYLIYAYVSTLCTMLVNFPLMPITYVYALGQCVEK